MFFFADIFFGFLAFIVIVGAFFLFDEVILKGYFATVLRKRFDVTKL